MEFFKLLCDFLKLIVIYSVIDKEKDKSYKYGVEKSSPTPPTPPFLLTIGKLKPPLMCDSTLGEVSALLTEGSYFPSARVFRNNKNLLPGGEGVAAL